MSQVNDTFAWLKESVSTVFRHILPGILILVVCSLSKPSWFPPFDLKDSSSILILAAIAMVIGNAWYVFHRYFALQFLDFLAYFFQFEGRPIRGKRFQYRKDLARHVVRYFRSLPKMGPMGKHIRDRFSSFNFMFIVSEVFLIFSLISDPATFLYTHRPQAILLSSLGLASAFWQYLLVRVIDEEFSNPRPRTRWMFHHYKHRRTPLGSNHKVEKVA